MNLGREFKEGSLMLVDICVYLGKPRKGNVMLGYEVSYKIYETNEHGLLRSKKTV